MATTTPPRIEGTVSEGFEAVRDAFVENFTRRGEVGGACCVYLRGEPVVDLWGGVRDRATGDPWEARTMVIVHSATKGLSALALALAHSRGLLDYDERVAAYWPEFAGGGKDAITVRQLLAHQAGLFAFDEHVDRDVVADPVRLAGVMERQRPIWEPGERQAYHAITLGFYESELMRRIDPSGRGLGEWFHDELAGPLDLDFWIGTPDSVTDAQLAPLEPPGAWTRLTAMPLSFTWLALWPRSVLHRSLVANPGTAFYVGPDKRVIRDLEVPSGGGVGSARAIARAYGAFVAPGGPLGLRQATVDELTAPATPARHGFHDELFRSPAKFSLGFMRPNESFAFGHDDRAFGAPGAGGAMGYADPTLGVGYGYVTGGMGTQLNGDPRDRALRTALESALRRSGSGTD